MITLFFAKRTFIDYLFRHGRKQAQLFASFESEKKIVP